MQDTITNIWGRSTWSTDRVMRSYGTGTGGTPSLQHACQPWGHPFHHHHHLSVHLLQRNNGTGLRFTHTQKKALRKQTKILLNMPFVVAHGHLHFLYSCQSASAGCVGGWGAGEWLTSRGPALEAVVTVREVGELAPGAVPLPRPAHPTRTGESVVAPAPCNIII